MHLFNIHGIESSTRRHAVMLESLDTNQDSEPKRTKHPPVALRSLSRGQLIALLSKERERYDVEQRKRRELEAQLDKLREKHEERESILLNLLVKS